MVLVSEVISITTVIFESDDDWPSKALRLAVDIASGSEVHLARPLELDHSALSLHSVHTIR